MDVTQTHLIHELKHDRPLFACRFDLTGKYVFVGSEDYSVVRMEIKTGAKVAFPTEAWVRAIAVCDDGKTLVTGGYDGKLIWWPADDDAPKPIRSVEAHHGWIRSIAVSPDGKSLASVGNDLAVKLWNVADGSKQTELTGHESHIYNATFHPDGQHLVTGDLMCNVFDWDLSDGKNVRQWKAESLTKFDKGFVAQIGGFRGMTFSEDGQHLLCSGITNVSNAFAGIGNPSVVAFNWKQGKQTIEHLSKGKLRGVAWGVASLKNGQRVAATGGSGGYLLFWKPEEANEYHNMKLKDVARDLAISNDGSLLATPHFNGMVSIYSMKPKPTK